MKQELTVDFVAQAEEGWTLVLVEEGPWVVPFSNRMSIIQDRLYDCIDVVIDGHFCRKYPKSLGGNITIRLDIYGAPCVAFKEFFTRFTKGIFSMDEYGALKNGNEYIKRVSFCLIIDQKEIIVFP